MKRKFTFLIAAAFMLLTMMATTGTMWGQTTVTFTPGTDTGATSVTKGDITATMTTMNNSSYYQIYANQSGTFSTSNGNITQIEFTCTASGTNKYGPGNASADVGSYSYSGNTGTWTGNAESVTISSTAQVRMTSLSITYTPAGGGGGDTPSLSATPTAIDFGSKAINPSEPYTETFTVTYANLTENLTVSVGEGLTGISVSPQEISKDGDGSQVVTVSYNPTSEGEISGNITVSNTADELSKTVSVSGSSYDPAGVVIYERYTDAIVEGDYIIYNTNGAMKNVISSNRFANESVTVTNNTITNPEASVVWHIAADGDYWTIYNAAVNKYAGGTTSKNQGALLDEVNDHARWIITYQYSNFTIENYGRSQDNSDPANRYLRQNTTASAGWATYGSGTGYVPTLYKKAGATTYSVTYNANGATLGTVPTDNTAYSSGDEVTVLGNTGNLAKAGYIWSGWNTQADGNGTTYQADATFEITASTTLYAKWTPKAITGLAYTGTPTATQYDGQAFNPAGLTVTATFNDDSNEDVTASVVWTPNPLTIETTSVTGTYMELTVEVEGITVTYAPGTVNNPYTVAQAIAATPASGTSDFVYIHGIVSAFYGSSTSIMGDGNNYRYYISDDGTTTGQLLVYKGKGLNNVAFSNVDNLHIGDIVTIYGGLTMYSNASEIASGNYLTYWERPAVAVEAPAFSVPAGGYAETQTVTITCATDGAQIYYTNDGTDPTNESFLYDEEIDIEETTTIKAIAYVGENASTVSTAAYYILSNDNTYTVAEALAFETYPQNNIFVEGIVSTAPTNLISGGMLTYYISADGTTTNQLQIYKGKNENNTEFTNAGEIVAGDRVTIFGNVKIYNEQKEFDQGNYLITLEGYTYPVINADNINIAHDATSGTINYTVNHYLAGTMTATTEDDWISEFNTATNGQVSFTTTANPNDEARSAQVTLTFTDITGNFSTKVVTVTQAQHVNDSAELPFHFENKGRDEISTTAGLTQYGLGEDIITSTYETFLNFDDAGDWMVLKTNAAPGQLSFYIYNEGFSGGTFKIQASADGETYSDLAVYTSIDGSQINQTYYNLDENTRYIRWIYTEKGSGAVGLGHIYVYEYVSPIRVVDPDQEIDSYLLEVSSASNDGYRILEFDHLYVESLNQCSVVFCNSDGTQLEPNEQPDWLFTTNASYFANLTNHASGGSSCLYYFNIEENTSTSPREAYFRFKCVIDENSYYSLLVTVTQAGYVPQNYTVTFNTNGGEFVANQDFSSTSTNVVEGEHNLPSATKDGYTFMGWSDGTQTYAANAVYNVTGNVEFTAQWGSFEWVATQLADLTADDVFVIVGDNGETYAMSNDNGTSNAPSAVEVTVEDNKLSGNIDANIQWNLSISDDGYMFYPNGDSESWLYCTNANNGLRIGTGDNKHFSLADDGYITITETTKQRYLGIYNSQDWRSYENTTGNIANQTFAFYKRVEPSTEPSISLSSYEINAPANETIEFLTITPANIENFDVNNLSADYCNADGSEIEGSKPNFVEFAFSENEGYKLTCTIANNTGEARTAYFKVIYNNGGTDVVSNVVTVNQAEYVAPVATITVADGDANIDVDVNGVENATLAIAYENLTITENTDFDIQYYDENGDELGKDNQPDWMEASIQENSTQDGYEVSYSVVENDGEARTAYFKVFAMDDNTELVYSNLVTISQAAYVPPVVTEDYELFSGELVEGDYIIYYNGYAMKNTVSSNRLSYETVTPSENVISTNDATIVWHIAPSGDYWTIYSADANAYAASTGTKNQAQMLGDGTDDKALWTASGTSTYEFVNKYNDEHSVNRNLRNNGTNGFACYSSQTGGALSLYKKVDNSPSISLSSYEIEAPAEPVAPATAITGSLTVTLNNITISELDQLGVDFCDENGTLLSGPDSKPSWFASEFELVNEEYRLNYTIEANDVTEERVAYFKVYEIDSETYSNLVTVTQEALVATITVNPDSVEADADGAEGYLAMTLTNIVITEEGDGEFDLIFCDNEGEPLPNQSDKPDWFAFDFQYENEAWSVYYLIGENATTAPRTAYFIVYGLGDNLTTEAYSNLVTVTQEAGTAPEYTVTFSVIGTIDDNLTATGSSITLPTTSYLIPEGFTITGWSESNTSTVAVANPYTPTANVTLYAITYQYGEDSFELVTDASDLADGDIVVIAALNSDYAMSTIQNNNNRGQAAIVKSGNQIALSDNVCEFVLGEGSEDDSWSFYDAVNEGYIYAASSSSNWLRTETGLSANSSWTISIEENAATITAQGNYTRNVLQYNLSSSIFSCYASASQQAVCIYKKNAAPSFNIVNTITEPDASMSTNIPETTCVVVEEGAVLTFTGTNEGTAANIVVQEGGQLIHTADVEATVQIGISGYGSKSGDGWYFIASPVDNLPTSTIATGTYDLFIYNEPNAYWYSSTGTTAPFTTLERGVGYLYANTSDINLDFAGLMIKTNQNIEMNLSYTEAMGNLKGFNLMGNPFTRNLGTDDMKLGGAAVASYYGFDDKGEEIVVRYIDADPIKPGQGFMVQATAANQKLVFNPGAKAESENNGYISIVAGNENGTDNAFIHFGNVNTLRKMTFSGDKSQVYVMNNGDDYAAARLDEAKGLVPVHFVAAGEGMYTITIEAKNLDLETLRLIDNFTGEEIDLLVEPSYTFKANSDEPANRFTLLFEKSTLGIDENYAEKEVFAYQSGDEIYFNGEGTLQVFDVMGRFVMSREINGNDHISTSMFNTGVYVFRLNGETVMTQKIVIR